MPRAAKTVTGETVVTRAIQLIVKYQEPKSATALVVSNSKPGFLNFAVTETLPGEGEAAEPTTVEHTVTLTEDTVKRLLTTVRKMV